MCHFSYASFYNSQKYKIITSATNNDSINCTIPFTI